MKQVFSGAAIALATVGFGVMPAGAQSSANEVLATIQVPLQVERLMEQGLPPTDARNIMRKVNRERVSSVDVASALDAASQAENGRRVSQAMPNFGDFVVAQVEAGLRGQDLARAVHTELRSRGVPVPEFVGTRTPGAGRPDGVGRPAGRGERPDGIGGRPDGAERPSNPQGYGRPDGVGRPSGSGR